MQMPRSVALRMVCIDLLLNLIHIQVHMPSKNHLHNQNKMGTEGIYVQLAELAWEQAKLMKGKLEWKALVLWYYLLELEMAEELQEVQLSDWAL